MIVNLYVDHMMSTPPASSEQVYAATQEHAKQFSDAASRIGMTPAEYHEFRRSLLDGKVTYVRLPHRLDAMSGDRRGSIYAVKNAVMTAPGMGWRVALADGNVVYVPQVCGNISLLRNGALAAHRPTAVVPIVAAAHTHRHRAGAPFTPAVGPAPAPASAADTPVSLVPPEQAVPAAEAPATVAQVSPVAAAAAAHGPFAGIFALPFLLAGAVVGATHHSSPGDTPAAVVPPCTSGSNALNACQSK